ncbi:MAG: hypothetical protein KAX49_05995 [Halanaerobiales bacterium]|nr:hypothetical protein [Halanaerobiales bacterium]
MIIIFTIKSYIKKPNTIIKDLTILNDNYKDFFAELGDEKAIEKIVKDIDTDYIEGAIYLKYNETILMDFTYWDIIDQLWAYMVNLVDDSLKNQETEFYFPDQPIKLQIKSLSNNFTLLSIESTTKTQITLPKYDFYKAILESAKEFFLKTQEYFGNAVEYSYESELINKLENELANMI